MPSSLNPIFDRRWRAPLLVIIAVVSCCRALAQVPFPSPNLLATTNAQQAVAIIGATKAENTGHLLIDAPEAPG